jgi:hypothetical protein
VTKLESRELIRQRVSAKRRHRPTKPYGAITQDNTSIIVTAVRTSNVKKLVIRFRQVFGNAGLGGRVTMKYRREYLNQRETTGKVDKIKITSYAGEISVSRGDSESNCFL